MHATRSHTRKERCGEQYVFIPFTIVSVATNEEIFVNIANGLIVFVVYFQ